jgi:acyl-CoA oxidase
MERVSKLSMHLTAGSAAPGAADYEALRSERLDPNAVRQRVSAREAAQFDVADMKHWLDNDNHAMRDEMRDFLKDPIFVPKYDISLKEERDLALARLKKLCERPGRFVAVEDFKTNPTRIFAAHEIACLVEGATATKLTVSFNLFGGTYVFCHGNGSDTCT